MNLDLKNDLVNNVKENGVVFDFLKELSKNINNEVNNSQEILNIEWNNLIANDLELYGSKIISIYKDKMLLERTNILQNYAEKTKDKGEMFYIYNKNDENGYNICECEKDKSHNVIKMSVNELPENAQLGIVLRKNGEKFVLDIEASNNIAEDINLMIKEKIEEQKQYLESKRIEGHVYEVGEKYDGRMMLFDISNSNDDGMEAIEEIDFPDELYNNANEGDTFIFKDGKYQI